ncbi:unnamed protein product, partial [Closterium sp. NIES-54]
SEGLGFESQCVHFGNPGAGGCQRSTGDPRLILGKGYRHVGLGGYGRTDLLLNKPFYPNGPSPLARAPGPSIPSLRPRPRQPLAPRPAYRPLARAHGPSTPSPHSAPSTPSPAPGPVDP